MYQTNYLSGGQGWRRETGLSPPAKYFTDRSKAVLLLWIIYVFLSCVCYAFVCVCLFVPCGHLLGKGWPLGLAFVVSNCEFVTFPLVSWVRCGTWLYRFLIFAPLLTFVTPGYGELNGKILLFSLFVGYTRKVQLNFYCSIMKGIATTIHINERPS